MLGGAPGASDWDTGTKAARADNSKRSKNTQALLFISSLLLNLPLNHP